MAEEKRVILHGIRGSPNVKRVELALKIKGIPFDFVEEDLTNKSASLLKYNPVYKKVPVLVHNGKPILESLVILEYIDETWKNKPRFLPEDAYERARFRFWAGYIQQLLRSTAKLFNAEGKEALDEARREISEKLDVLEEGIRNIFSAEKQTSEKKMDLLDIMITATLGAFRAQEEFFGFKILDPEKHPMIFQWVTTVIEMPVVKEITPPHHELVSMLQHLRQLGYKFN